MASKPNCCFYIISLIILSGVAHGSRDIVITPSPGEVVSSPGDNVTFYYQLIPWPPPCCKFNVTDGDRFRHVLVTLTYLRSPSHAPSQLCSVQYEVGKWKNDTGKCSLDNDRMLDFYPDSNYQVSFTLTNVSLYDMGRYVLSLAYSGSEQTDYSNLTVVDVPPAPILTPSHTGNLTEGTKLTIRCTVTKCSPPPTQLQWSKRSPQGGSISLPPDDDHMAGEWQEESWSVISVGPVTWRDHGVPYTCKVTNTVSSTDNSVSLSVLHQPHVSLGPCSQANMKYRIIEGSDVPMMCTISAYPHYDVITWSKDDVNLDPVYNKTQILLQDVTTSDSGRHSCSTFNAIGRGEAECQLDVLYGCRVTMTQQIVVKEGQEVDVTCHVDANPAAEKITWSRSNDIGFKQENKTLYLVNVSPEQADNYTCTATNIMQPTNGKPFEFSASKILHVIVEYKARWREYAVKKFAAEPGMPGVVQCQSHSYPSPVFYWSQNGNNLTEDVSSNLHSSNLTISDIKQHDYDTYNCHVTNSEGHVTFDLQLLAPGVPDEAQACTLYNVTSRDVTYVCHDGYDGGRSTSYKAMMTSGHVPTASSQRAGMSVVVISDLQPLTNYTLDLYTVNEFGSSVSPITLSFSTQDGQTDHGGGGGVDVGAVVGGVFAVILGLILIGLLVILYKRRHKILQSREASHKTQVTIKQNKQVGSHNYGFVEETNEKDIKMSNDYLDRRQWKNDVTYHDSDSQTEDALPVVSAHKHDAWEISPEQLTFHTFIGQGYFSEVWSAFMHRNGSSSLVAVKILKANCPWDEHTNFMEDLNIMKSMQPHGHVINLLACSTKQDAVAMVMEYAVNGSLLAYLREQRHGRSSLTMAHMTSCAAQIVNAMDYIASRGLIHKDLAARSVLLDSNFHCKLSDLTAPQPTSHVKKLPIRWMAPETLFDNVHTSQSDVWSMGVLLWEIITLGSSPWPGMTGREVMDNVRTGHHMSAPPSCPYTWYEMMCSCWRRRPSQRPLWRSLRHQLEDDLSMFHGDVMNGDSDVTHTSQLTVNISDILHDLPDEKC